MAKSAAAAAAAPTAIKQSSELKPRRSPSAPSLSLPAASAAMHDLDRVIHERVRLGIISALAANQSLTFNDLKKLLDTTDGNLSVHARKLEEAGYILCSKSFEGRMPKTEYRLTEQGSLALTKYIDHMEALIHSMRGNHQ